MIEIFFKLMIGHALADFALQSDAMAKGKNRNRKPDPGLIPPGQKYMPCWYHWLTAHALIHAGMVWIATGLVWLALLELVYHWLIDFAKCENWTNPNQDQALHILCKVGYVVMIWMAVV